jgi:hypothetical protein
MIDSRLLELANKINSMANHGTENERIVASSKLKKLMGQHGIQLSDLDNNERERIPIKYKYGQEIILCQCCMKILGKDTEILFHKRKNLMFPFCTQSEFLKIKSIFDYFWEIYNKEISIFRKAFILKNNIMPFDADTVSIESLSEKDQSEMSEVAKKMDSITKVEYQERIDVGACK